MVSSGATGSSAANAAAEAQRKAAKEARKRAEEEARRKAAEEARNKEAKQAQEKQAQEAKKKAAEQQKKELEKIKKEADAKVRRSGSEALRREVLKQFEGKKGPVPFKDASPEEKAQNAALQSPEAIAHKATEASKKTDELALFLTKARSRFDEKDKSISRIVEETISDRTKGSTSYHQAKTKLSPALEALLKKQKQLKVATLIAHANEIQTARATEKIKDQKVQEKILKASSETIVLRLQEKYKSDSSVVIAAQAKVKEIKAKQRKEILEQEVKAAEREALAAAKDLDENSGSKLGTELLEEITQKVGLDSLAAKIDEELVDEIDEIIKKAKAQTQKNSKHANTPKETYRQAKLELEAQNNKRLEVQDRKQEALREDLLKQERTEETKNKENKRKLQKEIEEQKRANPGKTPGQIRKLAAKKAPPKPDKS